jgi:hypothetical protein
MVQICETSCHCSAAAVGSPAAAAGRGKTQLRDPLRDTGESQGSGGALPVGMDGLCRTAPFLYISCLLSNSERGCMQWLNKWANPCYATLNQFKC